MFSNFRANLIRIALWTYTSRNMDLRTPTDNIPFQSITAAKDNIEESIIRTPLIPLNYNVPGKQVNYTEY